MAWLVTHRESPTRTVADANKPSTPLQVEVASVQRKSVPYLWHTVGQVEASHSVAVRPQVSGTLQQVAFEEGAAVQQGQLLFSIDPAPFAAAVAIAKAQLAKDQAVLKNARWQADRQQDLENKNYASALDFENAKSLVAETEATIALDQAALEQAEIQLGYCAIRAPIDGYTGALSVKAGNLVQASQTTPLVTIHQIQPALVRIAAPQQQLETVRASQRAGNSLLVRTASTDHGRLEGELVFIDNSADPGTGTILMKARFANTDGDLWPGTFIELDLISGEDPRALVVPETAVQQGQNGPFVFLVSDGHVSVQPVITGRQVGSEVVIEQGLDAGVLVVTRVPRHLEAGSAVETRSSQ
jgi:multidrug efflux system membrane fusion protein